MKYLKTYEELNQQEPKIGEYIVSYIPKMIARKRDNYLHVGKIVDKKPIQNIYKIHYYKDNEFANTWEDIEWWKNTEWWIPRIEIIDHGINKKDLENFVYNQKKFNV